MKFVYVITVLLYCYKPSCNVTSASDPSFEPSIEPTIEPTTNSIGYLLYIYEVLFYH